MPDFASKLLGIPAMIAAFFGAVGLTFETLTALGLYARLLATGVLALVIMLGMAQVLAVRTDRSFGYVPARESRPPRLAGRAFALGAVAIVLAGLAWLQANLLTVTSQRMVSEGTSSLTMRPALLTTNAITVPLPPPPVACSFSEQGASLEEIDWERPTRQLRITNFQAPQTVRIECQTEVLLDVRNIAVQGNGNGVHLRSELRRLIVPILLGGVGIWIAGFLRLRALSFR